MSDLDPEGQPIRNRAAAAQHIDALESREQAKDDLIADLRRQVEQLTAERDVAKEMCEACQERADRPSIDDHLRFERAEVALQGLLALAALWTWYAGAPKWAAFMFFIVLTMLARIVVCLNIIVDHVGAKPCRRRP